MTARPIDVLVEALMAGGIEALCGVPDSTLPGLGEAWAQRGRPHLVTPNEGTAAAVAAGHRLGGSAAAVYLQNTGLGVALDVHGSLGGGDVLGLPALWVVGWRGHPELPDQAHHRWHGEYTERLLHAAGFELHRLPECPARMRASVEQACARVHDHARSCALLVRPGTFARPAATPARAGYGRRQALLDLLDAAPRNARVVVGVGFAGRELASVRAARGEDTDDVYAAGGMGHASALALGLARALPDRPVVCIDGDGALAMHLGSSVTVAHEAPSSFTHVVLDNGGHESVGGDPTTLAPLDVSALARALGYRTVAGATHAEAIGAALARPGPRLLHVRTTAGLGDVPPRPRPTPPPHPTKPGLEVGPRLFTPGPGRLSLDVGRAAAVERGSRSEDMDDTVASVRASLQAMLADASYGCIPIAGSATTALDAILGSLVPRDARLLCVQAGRYGARIGDAAQQWGHTVTRLRGEPTRPLDPASLDQALHERVYDWVSLVHGETSTGVLHPIAELTAVARNHGVAVLLDAVSTIGTMALNLAALGVDVAFGSAAKALEGPSGLGFVLASRARLEHARGGPSLTLDLGAAWSRLQRDGQFRFTPPTGTLRGLRVALRALEAEGGPDARGRRYRRLAQRILDVLAPFGHEATIQAPARLPLLLAMRSPEPAARFIAAMRQRGVELYAAATDDRFAYRVGLVGVTDDDVDALQRAAAAHYAGEDETGAPR